MWEGFHWEDFYLAVGFCGISVGVGGCSYDTISFDYVRCIYTSYLARVSINTFSFRTTRG